MEQNQDHNHLHFLIPQQNKLFLSMQEEEEEEDDNNNNSVSIMSNEDHHDYLSASSPTDTLSPTDTSSPTSVINGMNHTIKNGMMRMKKSRNQMNPFQVKVLTKVLDQTAFPSKAVRDELSKILDVPTKSIQIWFQNQRQKTKSRLRSATKRPIPIGSEFINPGNVAKLMLQYNTTSPHSFPYPSQHHHQHPHNHQQQQQQQSHYIHLRTGPHQRQESHGQDGLQIEHRSLQQQQQLLLNNRGLECMSTNVFQPGFSPLSNNPFLGVTNQLNSFDPSVKQQDSLTKIDDASSVVQNTVREAAKNTLRDRLFPLPSSSSSYSSSYLNSPIGDGFSPIMTQPGPLSSYSLGSPTSASPDLFPAYNPYNCNMNGSNYYGGNW